MLNGEREKEARKVMCHNQQSKQQHRYHFFFPFLLLPTVKYIYEAKKMQFLIMKSDFERE